MTSAHLETVLFRPGCVNLRDGLCGVPLYASAPSLDFLAGQKIPRFRIGNKSYKCDIRTELLKY